MGETAEEQFKEWLDKNEIIAYSEYNDKRIVPKPIANALVVFFIVAFILSVVYQPIFIMFLLILIAALLTLAPRTNSFTDANENTFLFKKFAITEQRLILIDEQERATTFAFKDIYNISIRDEFLEIIILPFNKPQIIKITTSSPTKLIQKHLTDNWENKSPFTNIHPALDIFSKKYDLKFKAFPNEDNPNFKLEGNINNIPFSFTFKIIYDLLYFEATLECSNEEENYLAIYPEKSMDSIAKLIGKQDYKIGHANFDKKFIIQSNHKTFVESILEEDIINTIDESMKYLQGKITMGDPQKMPGKKKLSTTNNNIALDAHLISENEGKINRLKNHNSSLDYLSTDLKNYKNIDHLFADIISNLEMLISLAQRINAYDGK